MASDAGPRTPGRRARASGRENRCCAASAPPGPPGPSGESLAMVNSMHVVVAHWWGLTIMVVVALAASESGC